MQNFFFQPRQKRVRSYTFRMVKMLRSFIKSPKEKLGSNGKILKPLCGLRVKIFAQVTVFLLEIRFGTDNLVKRF